MKHVLTYSALLAATALSTGVTASPISVSGLNTDLVADAGNGAIGTVTNGGVISAQQWTVAETGYTGAGTLSGVGLDITADTVTTQNGTVFFVDPDANNALVNDGTLTLNTPAGYSDLQFLLFMVSSDVSITVNFSDTSSTVFTETGIGDWQNPNALNAFAASSNAEEITGVRRLGTVGQRVGINPRELSFDLSPADQLKTITSIDFDFSSNDRSSVMAVSGTVIPEPSSLALLGLGGLLIARRRRG
jgi:hypothetical protein